MASRITDSLDLGENEDGNISNWGVSILISSLKSTFCAKDFAKVEAVLVAREEKSKTEIETLRKQKDLFFYKSEEERLDRMSLEDELKKCRKGYEEMRNEVSKLREENMVLGEKEKSAEERCKKLLEEVRRIGDKEHEMIDLRSRNCELECAKAKAESEMEILRKRFEDLGKRVLKLESYLTLLKDQEDSKRNGIWGQNRNMENGRVKPDETMKVDEVSVSPSCDSSAKANGHSRNAGCGRSPSQNIVEIVDIDSDDDCAEAEILSEKGMTHPAENSNSDQICIENGTATLKRKLTVSIDVGQSENGDNDDNTLNGKLRMKKLQEPVCKPDDFPLTRSTTISFNGNEVNRGLATSRGVSRQREQQTESELKSQNLMNGFPLDGLGFVEESSSSSDSDSDDDNDGVGIFFNNSQVASVAQQENRN